MENCKPWPKNPQILVYTNGLIRNKDKIHFYGYQFTDDGYARVGVGPIDGYKKTYVHRLVAETWIPNADPDRLIEVNHIDGNKLNNSVNNLEWCDRKYNMQEYIKTIRPDYDKPVTKCTKFGHEFIETYACFRDAIDSLHNKKTTPGDLKRFLEGKDGANSFRGYWWRYATEEEVAALSNE